jgi:PAS domain S-box-containing protein
MKSPRPDRMLVAKAPDDFRMSYVKKPRRPHLTLMALPLVAGMVLSLAIFLTLKGLEERNAEASFDIAGQERLDGLQTSITLTLNSLVSLGAFYDHAPDIQRPQFARFAKDLQGGDNAIQAMEWIPRTPKRLRANREASAQRDGLTSFEFTERLPQGQLTRAGDRAEYFPVFFVEPIKSNEKALGFDLASDPVRNAALVRSAATGNLIATGRVKLVQETADQYGFLVFRPVYRGAVLPASGEERRERLTGFTLAVFRVSDIVGKAGDALHRQSGLHVAIFDADAKPGERLLYPKGARMDDVGDLPHGFRAIREVPVAGRRWVIAVYPDPQAFNAVHWSSWSALAGGILLTVVLAGYLRLNRRWRLEIENRKEQLEALVHSRTTELEGKESQLRLLLESTAEAIYGIDLEGKCTFCNPACLRLLGYVRAEELLGKNMHDQMHHSRQDGSAFPVAECHIFQAFWKGIGTHITDEVLWRADGSFFPAEYWSHPQRRGSEIVGAVVTFIDITESKRVEEELRLAQTSVEHASDAVSWLDSQGHILYVNEAACCSLGRSREELVLLSNTDIVPDLTAEAWATRWAEVKTLGSTTYESCHITKLGHIYPVEVSATYVEFGGKEFMFKFARDITQRKQIEKELGESENYVTALLATMPTGVVVIDSETQRVTDANSFALALMGRERGQVVGQMRDEFFCSAEVARGLIRDSDQKSDYSEHFLLRPDGSRLPILKGSLPLVRQDRTYLVEAFGDLTDLKRTQSDLQKAKEAAEAADRAKSAFLANMSHEIRTPMNAVLGYTQLMLRDPSLGGEAKKHLNIIKRSGEHLLALINDVLAMSKIEAGRMELKPVRFDLSSLVSDMAAMFRLRAEAKGLSLEVYLDGDTSRRIVADQGKIREVLINLLGNAVKFTESGWIKLRASVGPRAGRPLALALEVEDTGPGIGLTEQAKLFRPFVQAQSTMASQNGTGLGLAISREFARLMGGEITLSSEVNKGSIFHFQIPVEADASEQVSEPPVLRPVVNLRPGPPPRVLIVDDDAHGRGWVAALLKSIGFEVREADRGDVAIRVWRAWEPQLILMDIRMPGMDGLEAARAIKTEAAMTPPIIVALTAGAMDEERDLVMRSGVMDNFISKPCREGELLEKLRTHLGLDYLYPDEQPDIDTCTAVAPAGGAELLAGLPTDWIDRLRDAVLQGDKGLLDQLIRKVEEMNVPAARSLQPIADRYGYDLLLRWFDDALEAKAKMLEEYT